MKIRELFESPQSDREFRAEAEAVFSDLVKYVTLTPDWRKFSFHSKGVFVIPSTRLRNANRTMSVVLRPRDEQRKGLMGGFNNKNSTIHLFFKDMSAVESEIRSRDMKMTFVHEYIHLIDDRRSGGMISNSSNLANVDYFNNDAEYNAFYQEAISKFEDFMITVRRKNPTTFKQIVQRISSFEEFKRIILTQFEKDFIKYKNKKTDRKLNQRLYKYWNDEIVGNT